MKDVRRKDEFRMANEMARLEPLRRLAIRSDQRGKLLRWVAPNVEHGHMAIGYIDTKQDGQWLDEKNGRRPFPRFTNR